MAAGSAVAADLGVMVVAATVLGLAARRTGQPTIVAYIMAGILLGPVTGLVSSSDLVEIVSELGLAFLLFLIGLEIDLDEIRDIAGRSAVIGALQLLTTFLVGFWLAAAVGFSTAESLLIAAALMFSSTALVVKMLADRDQSSTLPGRLNVGVLLLQDLVVVLLLVVVGAGTFEPLTAFFELSRTLLILGGMAAIGVLASRELLPELFGRLEEDLHSLFVLGVGWALLFIFAAGELEVSVEIGAFVAGISLAQLPHRAELRERVRPLTELFMAVFFINFGLGLTAGELLSVLPEALLISTVIVPAKFAALFVLTLKSNFSPETSFISALNMTQVSEFGIVLTVAALQEGIVGGEVGALVSLVALLTMAASSYLIRYNREIFSAAEPLLKVLPGSYGGFTETGSPLEDHGVIVGYDEVTRHLVPALREELGTVMVVDRDPSLAARLGERELEFVHGDFFHRKIRGSASLETAAMVVSGSEEFGLNRFIAEEAGEQTELFLRASRFEKAAELYELGADFVAIENVIAADQVADYLELLLEDRDLFQEEVQSDLEKLHWGGVDG